MGGCRLLNPAAFPTLEPPHEPPWAVPKSPIEELIKRVWNYQWTASDEQEARNDPGFLPQPIRDAVADLLAPDYVRHRGDRIAHGRDSFLPCVRAVFDVCRDLRIDLESIVYLGNDLAVAQLVLIGWNRRFDGQTGPGALGVYGAQANGQLFRTATAVIYRMNNDGQIAEDWLVPDIRGLEVQLT